MAASVVKLDSDGNLVSAPSGFGIGQSAAASNAKLTIVTPAPDGGQLTTTVVGSSAALVDYAVSTSTQGAHNQSKRSMASGARASQAT